MVCQRAPIFHFFYVEADLPRYTFYRRDLIGIQKSPQPSSLPICQHRYRLPSLSPPSIIIIIIIYMNTMNTNNDLPVHPPILPPPIPSPAVLPTCDWAVEQCHQVGDKPTKCNRSGCNNHLHHLCAIQWAMLNNLPEGPMTILCREHHAQYPLWKQQQQQMTSGAETTVPTPGGTQPSPGNDTENNNMHPTPASESASSMTVATVSKKKKGKSHHQHREQMQ